MSGEKKIKVGIELNNGGIRFVEFDEQTFDRVFSTVYNLVKDAAERDGGSGSDEIFLGNYATRDEAGLAYSIGRWMLTGDLGSGSHA